MSSAICFNLDQSKILSSGNGLKTSFALRCICHLHMLSKSCFVVKKDKEFFQHPGQSEQTELGQTFAVCKFSAASKAVHSWCS